MSKVPIPSSQRRPRVESTTKSTTSTPKRPAVHVPSSPSPAKKTSATHATPSRATVTKPKLTTASKVGDITEDVQPPSPTKINLREAIALKRAEAKKALNRKQASTEDVWNQGRGASPVKDEEEDILGRASIPETIEKSKRNGSLNLTSRSLKCIPNLLFESHLGITPAPLSTGSVPDESQQEVDKVTKTIPSWQAQDLTTLKAGDNSIVELQPEISLFGALKHLDLHGNSLMELPNSLADLVNLVFLDLSRNSLTSLPPNLWSIPTLHTLNISSNVIASFNCAVSAPDRPQSSLHSNSFFEPVIERATEPLPKLVSLDASNNKLVATSISHEHLPQRLEKVNLSGNPLGSVQHLILSLSRLRALQSLDLQNCHLSSDSFDLLSQGQGTDFPKLSSLELGECPLSQERLRSVFGSQKLEFESQKVDPAALTIFLGKRVLREKWEIEAERRWEIKKSRSRVNLRDENGGSSAPASIPPIPKKADIVKEDWEIEAEQGLLTEGAKRRARAMAASTDDTSPAIREHERGNSQDPISRSASPTKSLTNALSSHYDESHQVLELPPALPRPTHSRTVSLAVKLDTKTSAAGNPLIPITTLPLDMITNQPFAMTLRVLKLSNRRVDVAFELPSIPDPNQHWLPLLDELKLDGCGLTDTVALSTGSEEPRSKGSTINLISTLFPSLSVLDLSQNNLTHLDGIENLILPDWDMRRKGLKVLQVQGNKIEGLNSLEIACRGWMNDGKVDGWRLEELDLRDNEIAKLTPELGLLPLDVLLVDGNRFRVPARRVWEREGTKGLLHWLKQRIGSE